MHIFELLQNSELLFSFQFTKSEKLLLVNNIFFAVPEIDISSAMDLKKT